MMLMMQQRQAAAAAAAALRRAALASTTRNSAMTAVRTLETFHSSSIAPQASSLSSSSSLRHRPFQANGFMVPGSSSSSGSSLLLQSPSFSAPQQKRSFSSTSDDTTTSTSSTDALLDLLVREHAEEVENANTGDAGMPPELEELHNELVAEDWKIVSDKAMTRMIKTVNSHTGNRKLKVQVSFHCQDTVQIADADADPESSEEDGEESSSEEEEDEEEAAPVRFTLTVTNPSVGTMVLQCLSENAQLQIQSVAMTSSSSNMESGDSHPLPASDYQGPEFDELAQDLQDAFYTFCIETCGINTDLCAFVAMQADFKEQEEYVRFLQEASNLLLK